jgi:hypothetical protein
MLRDSDARLTQRVDPNLLVCRERMRGIALEQLQSREIA